MRAFEFLIESSSLGLQAEYEKMFGSDDELEDKMTEDGYYQVVDNLNDAAQVIKHYCSPWLQASGGLPIYRGINYKNEGIPFYVEEVFSHYIGRDDDDEDDLEKVYENQFVSLFAANKNRKPRDSSSSQHDTYNKSIQSKNFVANRSNSVFCTGEPRNAGEYGKVWVVFPIGKFDFTWNDAIVDPWTTTRDNKGFLSAKLDKTKVAEERQRLLRLYANQHASGSKYGGLHDRYVREATMDILQHNRGKLSQILSKAHGVSNISNDDIDQMVAEHPNLSDDLKKKFTNICIAMLGDKEFKEMIDDKCVDSVTFTKAQMSTIEQEARANVFKSTFGHDAEDDSIDQDTFDLTIGNHYRNDNLPEAIKSKHEIMVSCDFYIGVSRELWSKIQKFL